VKIKAVTRQWEGGGYYRVRQPLDELARHGHETSCQMAKSDIEAEGADIFVGQFIGGQSVVMSKAGVPVNAVVLVHHWWRGLARDAKLVYELDDDPFEVEPHNPQYQHYATPVAHDSISHCIQVADLVTVSTPVLADRMRKHNPNVVVLQNRIDESMLTMQRPQRDKLTIGWAGSLSHLCDIQQCAYGLRRIMAHHKDIDVHFIGADYRSIVKSSRPLRHTPWCVKTTDYYKLIDFDIGIAPLVPTVFAETKSHIKALEYAALGIPVVASDSAPYRDFVIDGVTGFLVRRDHDWAARLRDLINDEAMRLEMGAKARELASHWTIQTGWQEWEQAYKGIL
jgi:glycosyltransferase involved in cell wall biosynthesis